jgi:2-dehydro-3-deoxygalactonokinase
MIWIAVDWGSTNLRAWRMDGDTMLAEARSDTDGANALTPDRFEGALLRLVAHWLTDAPVTVLICGVAGSREGWRETPYTRVPCNPAALRPHPVATRDPRLRVHIIGGLDQITPRAAVLRGEETQIAGFLAQTADFDGVICLPGTHTQWVHVSASEVISFQSFMTGELFALLGSQSILRCSVGTEGWDDATFLAGIEATLARPDHLSALLLTLRADDIVRGADAGHATARLSGWLIGAEIAAAKSYWLGRQVALVGSDGLCRRYASALSAQGVPTTIHRSDELVRAGLCAAKNELSKDTP